MPLQFKNFFDFSVSVVFYWGDLWIRKCHGCHTGQWRYLSNHRGACSERWSCPQHPQPHAFLWHVWLLWPVCLPCESKHCCSRCWIQVSCFCQFLNECFLMYFLQVGLPAKSGVSGAVLLVVPNVMGMMCWSPPLDRLGNSVRGIHFCQVISRHSCIDFSSSNLSVSAFFDYLPLNQPLIH